MSCGGAGFLISYSSIRWACRSALANRELLLLLLLSRQLLLQLQPRYLSQRNLCWYSFLKYSNMRPLCALTALSSEFDHCFFQVGTGVFHSFLFNSTLYGSIFYPLIWFNLWFRFYYQILSPCRSSSSSFSIILIFIHNYMLLLPQHLQHISCRLQPLIEVTQLGHFKLVELPGSVQWWHLFLRLQQTRQVLDNIIDSTVKFWCKWFFITNTWAMTGHVCISIRIRSIIIRIEIRILKIVFVLKLINSSIFLFFKLFQFLKFFGIQIL